MSNACGKQTIWGHIGNQLTAYRARCKSWKCAHCAPIRAKRLRRYARSGNPTTFLTLTARYGNAKTADQAAQRLVVCFRLLRQQLKRDGYAETIEFLAVFERTKRGWPHLHILMRAPYLPQERISELMAKWNDSPIIDIKQVTDSRRAVAYVTKYVAKRPDKFDGAKRYWASRHWIVDTEIFDMHPKKDRQWHYTKAMLGTVKRALKNEGFEVLEENDDALIVCTPGAFDDVREGIAIERGRLRDLQPVKL